MFKLCVVGHGNYPDGIVSALMLLVGADPKVITFNLNQELTHADYEQQLTDFLEDNDQVIVFADMTGGAPHQIASRLIIEKGKRSHYIVSSAPLNLILDILMKNNLEKLTEENTQAELAASMEMSKNLILMLPDEVDGSYEQTVNEGI